MTVREFISSIRNNLNSIHLDDYISGEYIYWRGINFVQFLINRNLKDRKILTNSSLMIQKNCIELEPYNCQNCSDIPFSSKNVMRSKTKLPSIFQSNFGELLNVFSIDNSEKFVKTTLNDYKNILKKRFRSKNPYFYISEGYLMIPDSYVDKVNINYLSFDLKQIIAQDSNCTNLLDLEFPCPSFLLSEVTDATVESLTLIKKINPDENSNLNFNEKT